MKRPFGTAALAIVITALSQSAATAGPITIFSSLEFVTTNLSPIPNALAALASWNAAVAAMGQTAVLSNFEVAPLGAAGAAATIIGGGVTLSIGNTPNSVISNTVDPLGGYNTTAGGSRYLRFITQTLALNTGPTTATATFSFANPINAFGGYFIGIQSDAIVTLGFNDGSVQSLALPAGPTNGTVPFSFFGFTDPGASVASVTLTNNWPVNTAINNIGYHIGIDDVRSSSPVPEPGSMLLLGTGVATLVARRRQRSN